MNDDIGRELLWKNGSGSEVPGDNDALASRKLLNLDFLGGESLEFRGEFLDGKGGEPFLSEGVLAK